MENQQNNTVSVGDWVLTILITAIPIVGFVMLFIWAFGGNAPKSKENWAKATLIWFLIVIGLYAIIFLTVGVAFLTTDEFAMLR